MTKIEIKKAEEKDIGQVQSILYSIIDELHEDTELRKSYKSNYTTEQIRSMIKEDSSICLGVRDNEKVIGFILGWQFYGIGNIHWMGLMKEYRGKNISKLMMDAAFKEFERHACYKVDLFTYPSLTGFYEKHGFRKISNIKNHFSINLNYMVKRLREPTLSEATKKIRVTGEGGQGVKLLTYILSNILSQLNYYVSLNLDYDAAVTGGNISADLIFSDYRITNPIIEEADILLQLSQVNGNIIAKKTISDVGLSSKTEIPFRKIASEKFGSPLVVNMLALGILLREIGINIEKLDLTKELPKRFVNTNLNAIRFGFSYRDTLA